MSDKPSSSSLLPRSMSLRRRKTDKKGSGGAGGSKASSGGSSAQGQWNPRRRNSDSVASGHSETFKLPSWLVPLSVYKNKQHAPVHRKGASSISRKRKNDSALTDSEGTVVSSPPTPLRTTRSMRNLFTRPSTSTLSSTRTRHHKEPFSPSLPPEIWVLIFQHATSPPNPFLASSAVSSHPCPSTSSSHSFLHFPHTQGHLLKEYRKSMKTKCDLTRVCRLWWAIGQEVLFEFVWLTRAREASLLAGLLSRVSIRSADVSVGVQEQEQGEEEGSGKVGVIGRVMGKGKERAKEVDGSIQGISVSTTTSVSYSTTSPSPSPGHSRNPSSASSFTPATSRASTKGTYTFPYDTRAIGRHIRRLHIETHSLDRCSPQDLLTILVHAPALQVFSDNQSIRRTSGFCVLSSSVSSGLGSSVTSGLGGLGSFGSGSTTTVISTGSGVSEGGRPGSSGGRSSLSSSVSSGSSVTISTGDGAAFVVEGSSSPMTTTTTISGRTRADSYYTAPQHQQESDMQLLSALISPQRRTTSLRRLSWTSYEYEAGDFEAGMAFYTRVIGPKLRMVSAHLEYLELTLCAKDLMRGVTGQGGTGGGFFESLIGAGNFTSSTITTTTTVTTSSSTPDQQEKSLSHSLSTETLRSIQSVVGSLTLPNLTSLKLTLDNVTCLVVSTWDLPSIRHVSLIASDFSYAHEGFASFFEVHGGRIEELELGHSTGAIEEFWLTAPPHAAAPHPPPNPHHPTANVNTANASNEAGRGWRFGSTRVPLAEWCPNLKTFICSADAEWNWENPDWIAPHVLLPAHPTVEVIGVRDIEKRIHEALGRAEYRDRVAVSEGRGFVGLDSSSTSGSTGEGVNDPFFALLEQLGSLVKSEAFPALKYVRDLSPQSRVIRETGRAKVRDVEMRSMGSFAAGWDEFDDDDEGEESEDENHVGVFGTTSVVTAGYAPSHGRGQSTFGQGGLVALWTAMMQNMASAPSASSPSIPTSSSSSSSSNSKPTGKALQKLLERQQGIRVLRFWKNVLGLFSGRGVYLEDCDGYNVTLARLRRAAALESGKA